MERVAREYKKVRRRSCQKMYPVLLRELKWFLDLRVGNWDFYQERERDRVTRSNSCECFDNES
jgi:hypothetical protein